uniref:Glycosyltransferase 2-like domain-containing protein n=1 Tax=viral metagenome TaxID=1070528 RepID=A0A6C0DAM1_9ZZZZ
MLKIIANKNSSKKINSDSHIILDKSNKVNNIRNIIKTTEPLEDKLNIIIVISNPCLYKRRYILAKQFIDKIESEETNVNLFIVELIYKNQEYELTTSNNPNHLQLKTDIPLWHKENMINLGVKHLLPNDWKAFAWIDADIEFENINWVSDALKMLNGHYDIIQLFSYALDLDHNNNIMGFFNSFSRQLVNNVEYNLSGLNNWHPGFAWACTRVAYEKMGGLLDINILGSGDSFIAYSIIQNINNFINNINTNLSTDIKNIVTNYENKCSNIRLGYIDGVIRHNFHGSKANRQYTNRWFILSKHNFLPSIHIKYDKNGVIVPTNLCPQGLLDDIFKYFIERNEDEFLTE